MDKVIKNIDQSVVLEMETLVEYASGQVISRTFAQNKSMSLTLFAFEKGEEISSHSSSGDAMVLILDGCAEICVGSEKFSIDKGKTIVMPAGVPHSLLATQRFKMLLTVVFPMQN